jgi:hypothetical protein
MILKIGVDIFIVFEARTVWSLNFDIALSFFHS